MGHDWRKHAIVNGVVMACRICGDVQGKRNRPCPGLDEGGVAKMGVEKRCTKSNDLDGAQVDFQI